MFEPSVNPAPQPSEIPAVDSLRRDVELRVADPIPLLMHTLPDLITHGTVAAVLTGSEREHEAVIQGLERLRLSELVLDLRERGSTRQIIEDLKSSLNAAEPLNGQISRPDTEGEAIAARLNGYRDAVHKEVRRTGISLYSAVGALYEMGEPSGPLLNLSSPELRQWSGTRYAKVHAFAGEIQQFVLRTGSLANHPFAGAPAPDRIEREKERFENVAQAAHLAGARYLEKARALFGGLKLPFDRTSDDIDRTLAALGVINQYSPKALKACVDVRRIPEVFRTRGSELIEAVQTRVQIGEKYGALLKQVQMEALSRADLDGMENAITAHRQRGFLGKMFDGSYGAAVQQLGEVVPVENSPDIQLAMVRALKELRQLLRSAVDTRPLLVKAFGEKTLTRCGHDQREWYRAYQVTHALSEYAAAMHRHPDEERVAALLDAAAPLYEREAALHEVLEAKSEFASRRSEALKIIGFPGQIEAERVHGIPLERQIELIGEWAHHAGRAGELADLLLLQKQAKKLGVEFLLEKALQWPDADRRLVDSLERSWLASIVADGLRSNALIEQFDREKHETLVRESAEHAGSSNLSLLDDAIHRHWAHLPIKDVGGSSSELHRLITFGADDAGPVDMLSQLQEPIARIKPIWVVPLDWKDIFSRCHFNQIHIVEGKGPAAPEIDHSALVPAHSLHAGWREKRDALDPFERALCADLSACGFEMRVIGETSGSRIAVANPADPTALFAVIRIDPGAAEPGEELPAKIPEVHVWSVEFQTDRPEALSRLMAALKGLATSRHFPLPKRTDSSWRVIRDGVSTLDPRWTVPYRTAVLNLGSAEKHSVYTGNGDPKVVMDYFRRVVELEGPIHVDEAARRVRQAAGLVRPGHTANQLLERALNAGIRNELYRERGGFLYPADPQPIVPRDRSGVQGFGHTFGSIAAEEIEAATERVVIQAGWIPVEDVPLAVSQLFGFKKKLSGYDDRFDAAIKALMKRGILRERDEQLHHTGS